MVLALISTACISNVIYSLQAMLIYARTSNAMGAEDCTGKDKHAWTIVIMTERSHHYYRIL